MSFTCSVPCQSPTLSYLHVIVSCIGLNLFELSCNESPFQCSFLVTGQYMGRSRGGSSRERRFSRSPSPRRRRSPSPSVRRRSRSPSPSRNRRYSRSASPPARRRDWNILIRVCPFVCSLLKCFFSILVYCFEFNLYQLLKNSSGLAKQNSPIHSL